MKKKPFVVGLTGGLGSGKSTVADAFAALGVPVIDADLISRELVAIGQPALTEIIGHFGKSILQLDGSLNRSALRDIVFNDVSEKIWLEHCLHPRIFEAIEKKIQTLEAPYCLVVIPLLTEQYALFGKLLDYVIIVDTLESHQMSRVAQRDNLPPPYIQKMLSSQATREARLAIANTAIHNDGTLADLQAQIPPLHAKFLEICYTNE